MSNIFNSGNSYWVAKNQLRTDTIMARGEDNSRRAFVHKYLRVHMKCAGALLGEMRFMFGGDELGGSGHNKLLMPSRMMHTLLIHPAAPPPFDIQFCKNCPAAHGSVFAPRKSANQFMGLVRGWGRVVSHFGAALWARLAPLRPMSTR